MKLRYLSSFFILLTILLSGCSPPQVNDQTPQQPIVTQPPSNVPPAVVLPAAVNITVTSTSCAVSSTDSYGYNRYRFTASGTASAPIGYELQLMWRTSVLTPIMTNSCTSWSGTPKTQFGNCVRAAGDPEQTIWSVTVNDITLPAYYNDIFIKPSIFSDKQGITLDDSGKATCRT